MTIKELERAKWTTWKEHDALVSKRRETERERLAAYRAELTAELDAIYRDPIAQAAARRDEAAGAYESAVAAEALARPRKVPLGSIMEEWKRKKLGPYRRADHATPTGRRGILEAVIPTTELPRLSIPPDVGADIVRIFTKDGKPGKLIVWGWELGEYWRPAREKAPEEKA